MPPNRPYSLTDAEVALEREVEGDLFLQDIGQGFGFRPGSFDGAISYVLAVPLHAANQHTHTGLILTRQNLRPAVALERRLDFPLPSSTTHKILRDPALGIA